MKKTMTLKNDDIDNALKWLSRLSEGETVYEGHVFHTIGKALEIARGERRNHTNDQITLQDKKDK